MREPPPSPVQPGHCVICDSPDLVEVHPAELERMDQVSFNYSFSPEASRTFRVVRCTRCTHMFCAPLPGEVVGSYRDVVDDEYLKHQSSRMLAAAAVLERVKARASGGALLDVGCATGDFLVAAREAGFAVEGLELSDWSCKIAAERGLTVHQETLAAFAARSESSYDVVSLIGVVEHFASPRAEMANIAKLLRPGGYVVIWTGDASSWLPRLLGRRWWYWQGQHIQYFTRKSLTRLASDAGLLPSGTERYPFAATHATLSNSVRRYPYHQQIAAALRAAFVMKPVIYLRLPGEMLFFARKP